MKFKPAGYIVHAAMGEARLSWRPEPGALSNVELIKKSDAVALLKEAREWFSRLSISTDSLGEDYEKASRFLDKLERACK